MDGFEKDEIAGNVAVDPFNDKFYATFNPIMASFDVNSGKCDGHYGKLEESQRLSKTGYYFLNNVYAHFGKDFCMEMVIRENFMCRIVQMLEQATGAMTFLI